MKMTRKSLILLAIVLFSTPVISGQDLSSYRKFLLGTSLAEITKQVGPYSHWTTVIHQRPAVIQELTLWSLDLSPSRVGVDPISQVLFSFYNGELYRIAVTYDRDATEGLTDEDMVKAVSARYGTGTRLYPEISFPTNDVFARSEEMVIARWEDSQNAVNLLRSTSNMNSFRLAVFTKRLDAQAVAASAEAVNLETHEAPQREIDRQKKEGDDLEIARQKNKTTFRP